MRAYRGGVSLFIALVMPLTTSVTAAWPDGGRIAFVSDRDGNGEIYVMDPDGSGQTNLTQRSAHDWCPAWSPDASTIAFVGDDEIWRMDDHGNNLQQLTSGSAYPVRNWWPTWSPDGGHIAFTHVLTAQDVGDIYRMDAWGGSQAKLGWSNGWDCHPAWSPDGAQIAFTRFDGTNWDIWIGSADGTGTPWRLTDGAGFDGYAAWSPDGSKIAYQHQAAWPDSEIYIRNADGSGTAQNLTENAVYDAWPTWSPDGTHIAFYRRRQPWNATDCDIVTIALGTGQETVLTGSPGHDYCPSWGSEPGDDSPEPATWALLACTALAGAALRRRTS